MSGLSATWCSNLAVRAYIQLEEPKRSWPSDWHLAPEARIQVPGFEFEFSSFFTPNQQSHIGVKPASEKGESQNSAAASHRRDAKVEVSRAVR